MRFAENGDLLDFILKNGAVAESQARVWFRQLALGVTSKKRENTRCCTYMFFYNSFTFFRSSVSTRDGNSASRRKVREYSLNVQL